MAQSQAPSREWTPRQFKKRDSGNPKRSKHEKKKDGAGVRNSRKAIRAYSLGEEIANSTTHGVGALLAIAAIPLCVVAAVRSAAACICLLHCVQHFHAVGICDVDAVSRYSG